MTGWPRRLGWSAYTLAAARGDERLPFAPAERIAALQARRVRSIVRHAFAWVPHYREAMRAAGLTAEDFREADDLARLPLVSGEELAAEPGRFASERYRDDQTVTLRSSGTGGRPKEVRYSRAALFTALAHGRRQRAVFAHFLGRRTGYREMTIHRSRSVAHQLRGFYEANAWFPRALDLERATLGVESSFADAARAIDGFRPDVLFGYGSYLGALYRWARERGRELHSPRVVWYGADAMPPADRDLLERERGAAVVSTYQADEALRLGFQCELRAGIHLCLDDVAVRVLAPSGAPAAAGEPGELVVSNLTNRATVLLNYRLGDVVSLARRACPCGRTLPTLERIEGRADDLLRLPDGEARHPLGILERLQAIDGVVRAQLVQEALDRVSARVVCVAGADWPPIGRQVEAVLREQLGAAMAVDCARVAEPIREPGGKVRAVVSRCVEPA